MVGFELFTGDLFGKNGHRLQNISLSPMRRIGDRHFRHNFGIFPKTLEFSLFEPEYLFEQLLLFWARIH